VREFEGLAERRVRSRERLSHVRTHSRIVCLQRLNLRTEWSEREPVSRDEIRGHLSSKILPFRRIDLLAQMLNRRRKVRKVGFLR